MKNKNALIVIDVQNDFCPGGSLAVNEGDKIVPVINSIMDKFDYVAATQDWHPKEHSSFASNHKDKKIYDQISIDGIVQILWPDHCVQGSRGTDFHSDLNTTYFDMILRKGTNPDIDSYSGFRENDKKTETGLRGYLNALSVGNVYICGLATDFCVFYTAMDSKEYGFETHVIIDACRGIDNPPGSLDAIIREMKDKGIKIINSDKIQ